ncbi:short chain dehydrogenase [Xylariaceae sp. FL0804]|nr:short chain dehydrogenase [Xylariaceae sp. FL0804]
MASLSVSGKYAIVTGGGSGINLAFTRLLLESGCSVLIGDLNLRPEAQQLLAEYPAESGSSLPSVHFQKTNVTSWPQLSALFAKGLEVFGRVDIVCPGAGLFEPAFSTFWLPPKTATNQKTFSRDIADAEPGTFQTIEVNLSHPIRLSQLAIGYWTRNKMPGTLVHVSSVAGRTPTLGTPLYIASKAGLDGFVRSLGSLRDDVGIRVSAVAPGVVKTPLWTEDPTKAALTDGNEGEFVEVTDVAKAMLQLCENPEYGDGTVLEVLVDSTRVVPTYNAPPPSGRGVALSGFAGAGGMITGMLKGPGMAT